MSFLRRPTKIDHPVALCLDQGDLVFLGDNLFPGTKIQVTIRSDSPSQNDAFFAIVLSVPMDRPKGTGYSYLSNNEKADRQEILIKMPLGKFDAKIKPMRVESAEELLPQMAMQTPVPLGVITITLHKDAPLPRVDGFRKPFASTDAQVHSWMTEDTPILGVCSLSQLLRGRRFVLICKEAVGVRDLLPAATNPIQWAGYPFSPQNHWDMERYRKEIPINLGMQYRPVYTWDSITNMIKTLSMPYAADAFWLISDAEALGKMPFRAAFVPLNQKDAGRNNSEFYCYVAIPERLKYEFNETWPRMFHTTQTIGVHIMRPNSEFVWNAVIDQDAPPWFVRNDIYVLRVRPASQSEKFAPESVKLSFHNSLIKPDKREKMRVSNLEKNERKRVEALNALDFVPDPTLVEENGTQEDEHARVKVWTFNVLRALDRDFKRGRGFWFALNSIPTPPPMDMLPSWAQSLVPDGKDSFGRLPIRNIFSVPDDIRGTILSRLNPEVRDEIVGYLESATMAQLAFVGFAGAGKTELLGTSGCILLENPDIKSIYISAPTNVATSNICDRIAKIHGEIVEDFNKLHTRKIRQRLILRGYSDESEMKAFWSILQRRNTTNFDRGINNPWQGGAWDLPHSLAFHALQLFGYVDANVPAPSTNCSEAFTTLQSKYKDKVEYAGLFDYARGTTQTNAAEFDKKLLVHVIRDILSAADLVCTTPMMAADDFYRPKNLACDAAILDEAGAMCMGDAELVRGNTMKPCILGGDYRQLPPVIMSARDVELAPPTASQSRLTAMDAAKERRYRGKLRNRFAQYGEVSTLEYLGRSGWPIFPLSIQYRMVNGLFDMSQSIFYSELNDRFSYGPTSAIENHPVAGQIEQWVKGKFSVSSPREQIYPLFISVSQSYCFQDGSSRFNPEQNLCALNLVRELMTDLSLDASSFGIITMYSRNKRALEEMMEADPKLKGIECSTVDSFQGREAQIMILVLVVTAETGPGFTSHRQRLNVATSRQQDYMFIVGELGTAPASSGDGGLDEAMRKMFKWFQTNNRIVNSSSALRGSSVIGNNMPSGNREKLGSWW
ncbi:P-loop containing nucleoside triphosphate hydrolase protein [Ilyonectria sp. MPI-CAGE-AT-0026]|nr:P-loop containing nucleoside triphosphate hydrolase protein [Ilyonectria sp. MPI-CAGE-AT-0026]